MATTKRTPNVPQLEDQSSSYNKKRIQQSIKISVDYNNLDTYNNIKDKIKPYDLIGFRGGDMISDCIAFLESKKLGIGVFSHVGLVVTSDILPNYDLLPGRLYILESTFSYKVPMIMDNVPDILTDKGYLGVQLRDLEEIIPRYITKQETKIAWCRLNNNPIDQQVNESNSDYLVRKRILSDQFTVLFNEYYGRRYELDMISLFAAMFPCLRIIRRGRDACYNGLYKCLHRFGWGNDKYSPAGWQFCSELVANIYQAIGVIPNSFNPKDVVPVDFLGYDKDGLPALVDAPVFIKDWDLPNQPAVVYKSD